MDRFRAETADLLQGRLSNFFVLQPLPKVLHPLQVHNFIRVLRDLSGKEKKQDSNLLHVELASEPFCSLDLR